MHVETQNSRTASDLPAPHAARSGDFRLDSCRLTYHNCRPLMCSLEPTSANRRGYERLWVSLF